MNDANRHDAVPGDIRPESAVDRDWEETLRSRGIPVDLAAALDDWSFVRRAAGDLRGAARFSSMARTLDPDLVRCEIRESMDAESSAELLALAQEEDLGEWEPRTNQGQYCQYFSHFIILLK